MTLLESPRQGAAVGLALVTSTIVFFRRLFVLERFRWPPTRLQCLAYGVSLMSGLLFWSTLNAVQQDDATIQMAFGMLSTTLSWLVLVLLVNDPGFHVPSWQQWASLGFYVLTEVSILVQLRLVIREG